MFWLAAGATVGVLVVRRISSAARSLTPEALSSSLGSSLGSLGEAVRDFGEQVRLGMSEREEELRAALGLDGSSDSIDAHTVRVAGDPNGTAGSR